MLTKEASRPLSLSRDHDECMCRHRTEDPDPTWVADILAVLEEAPGFVAFRGIWLTVKVVAEVEWRGRGILRTGKLP